MNVSEFAALKAGDIVQNAMAGSFGEVVDRTDSGVHVRWAGSLKQLETPPAPTADRNATVTRHYNMQTTAWMHWSLIEQEQEMFRGQEP